MVSTISFVTFIASWWIREPPVGNKRTLSQIVVVTKSVEQEEASTAN
jgi:hypothetical protein